MSSRGMASKANNEAVPEEFVKDQASVGTRVLSLDRPKVLHAINLPMIKTIQKKMNRWAELDIVEVVVFRSTGDRAFCAGGDIAQLYRDAKDPETRPKALELFRHEYALNFALGVYPKPIVAMIKGITMGGGVGLSIHGSIRVSCSSTVFAMPETQIGFFPDVGGGTYVIYSEKVVFYVTI
jgi:enoyl-CoA hydratase/carnithine racemase